MDPQGFQCPTVRTVGWSPPGQSRGGPARAPRPTVQLAADERAVTSRFVSDPFCNEHKMPDNSDANGSAQRLDCQPGSRQSGFKFKFTQAQP